MVVLVADFVMKKLSPQPVSGYATIEDELEDNRVRLQKMIRSGKR
jgi:hypothetical protein